MASPSYALAARILAKNSNASYDDVKKAAAKAGLTVAPVVYGLAKKNLGLTAYSGTNKKKRKTKGKKSAAKAAAASPRAKARPVGRPPGRKSATTESLEGLFAQVQAMEADRRRMQTALEQIRRLLDEALR